MNSSEPLTNPNPDERIGPVVEMIDMSNLDSFNDATCTHPEPWTRDETEDLGNAMMCANPRCHVIFMV